MVLIPLATAEGWEDPVKASIITSRTPLGRIASQSCINIQLFHFFLSQIRVNSINLTVVLTPLTIGHGWDNPEKSSRITSKIPLGRLAGISCSSTFKLQMMQLLQTVKSSLTKCLLTDRSYPSENSMVISICPPIRLGPDQM